MATKSENHAFEVATAPQQRGQDEIEKGRVGQVRQQFQVHEDTALAYKMQTEEIEHHVFRNREQRRSVRDSVKTAKETFLEEVKISGVIPEERLSEIAQKQWLAEELHRRVEEQESVARTQKEKQRREDEKLALQYQQSEELQLRYSEQRRLDKVAKAEEEHRRLRRIMKDLEEANLSGSKEQEYDNDIEIDLIPDLPHGNDIITLADGTIIDAKQNEIKTEEQRKQHLERKDEELAKILQEQENMQNAKQKHIDKDRRKALELQDREIAKHLQRKEKAKAERRQEQMRRGHSLPERNEVMSSPQRHLPTYHEALGIDDLENETAPPDNQEVEKKERKMKLSAEERKMNKIHRSKSQGDEEVSPRDEGVSPRDEGVSPRDEGVSPRDDGVSPRDEGVSPRDERLEFLVLPQEDGAHYNNVAETLDPTFRRTHRPLSPPSDEDSPYQLSPRSEEEEEDEQSGNKGAPIVPPVKRKSSRDKSKRKFWNF